jgi:hypothetical protein
LRALVAPCVDAICASRTLAVTPTQAAERAVDRKRYPYDSRYELKVYVASIGSHGTKVAPEKAIGWADAPVLHVCCVGSAPDPCFDR